ncbi:MAG: glycosyltransferase family 4 protein [Parvibaculum sp.]|nr:glycosyltransferase family 4 protein [Parvibaculum sp.]
MMICHYDDTNSSGGLDKQARLLSRTLSAAGEDVVMLASTRKWSRAGWVTDEGVRVRYFWTFNTPQIAGRHLPAALLWAAQLFFWITWHRAKISVFHCHQIRIHAFAAALANRLFKIPTILKSATGGAGADIITIGSHKYFGAGGRRFVIRHTSIFVATTETVVSDLRTYGVPPDKIIVIPNGLELGPLEVGEPPARRRGRSLFLGRLGPDKNTPALADAAARVAQEGVFEVDFYGRGRDQALLEKTIERNANGAVSYCGWTPDPAPILLHYGYLLLASDAEGLSNSMIEAMSQGVVPVTTRVSGCVDHITSGETGFYFEGVDRDSLAAALEHLKTIQEDEWMRLSARVSQYARERFDMKLISAAYRALYAKLTGGTQI